MKRLNELRDHLLVRSYDTNLVDHQIQRAALIPHPQALQPRPRQQQPHHVPLVTTYHLGLTGLTKIVNKHLPILHASKKLKQAIPNPPLVTFRQPKNLRDLLVRSALTTPAPSTNTGNNKCNNKWCKCCQEMVTSNTFESQITGRKYHIRSNITCKTTKNVYLISCKKCGLQYVGETENVLHVRMNGHRSDIRTRKTEKPVAAHFCQTDHTMEDLQVRGIEKIHRSSTQWRRERESFWIFTLRMLSPYGLNLDE